MAIRSEVKTRLGLAKPVGPASAPFPSTSGKAWVVALADEWAGELLIPFISHEKALAFSRRWQ
jgi:hypothetical protein